MKEVILTMIFGFSIKFCTHSCTKFESAKNFSEGFFLLAVGGQDHRRRSKKFNISDNANSFLQDLNNYIVICIQTGIE